MRHFCGQNLTKGVESRQAAGFQAFKRGHSHDRGEDEAETHGLIILNRPENAEKYCGKATCML
jgi:hypothetical protein